MPEQQTIQTSEPGQAAVHVPSAMGNGQKPKGKKKTPNSRFMQRMMVSMMERYSAEEVAAMKKTAAAHAGGMTKAERAKLACMQNELYKESAPDVDDELEEETKTMAEDEGQSQILSNFMAAVTGSKAHKKQVRAVIDEIASEHNITPFQDKTSLLGYVNSVLSNRGLRTKTDGANSDENCGIGKDGFMPGNTCAAKKAGEDDEDEFAESLTAKLNEISTAFQEWARVPNWNANKDQWPDRKYWMREVFATHVIAEGTADAELYKIPFQANPAGSYDFGMAVKVNVKYVAASEVADLCAEGNGWRLFVEHDFAEAPEWMPLLPKPGKYKHPKYGEIKLTKSRNANFADGVNKKIYQSSLPINTEHAPSNEGAFGWIEEARQNDDGSIDARVSWTDLGKDAIEKDRFRFISPEWADECESPDGKKLTDVIRGAAMTVRPFFKDKHLRPLVASERGLETLDHALPASDQPQLFFFTALLPSAPASQPGIQTYKEPTPMAEKKETIESPEVPVVKAAETPAVDALKFAEMETKLQALEAENTATKQAAEIQAFEVKKLSEANAKLTDEAETLKFTEEVEGKSKANKHAYVGEFAKHVAHMKDLAKAFGEDSEQLKFYMETQRQSAALAESSLLFAEKGRGGGTGGDGTAYGKIAAKAKELQSINGKTFEQSFAEVLKIEPQLYAEYQAEEGN